MSVDEDIARWKAIREIYELQSLPKTIVDSLIDEVERLRVEVKFLKENRDAFMLLAGRMISDSDKLGNYND